jgi:hypothetical protein
LTGADRNAATGSHGQYGRPGSLFGRA